MASSYTLKFSDPNTSEIILVEGTTLGTGKNNYDTSLDLIGPGYPNYGHATAQNFLKLLENFASPYPPDNAIKGQLWYDTSDPNKFVLRVNNGSLTSARWPSASGIYQQSRDPFTEFPSAIREGDIWVDTNLSQLKIRYGTGWNVVGPGVSSGANKSGSEVVILESIDSISYPVIRNWVNGKVVEIISNNEFTPRAVIEGFSLLKVGSNLTSRNSAKYNGLAERASSLEVSPNVIIRASEVLKNKATSQIHTGTFTVESTNGLFVKSPNSIQSIKIFTAAQGGVTRAFADFSSTATNSTFKVGIRDNSYLLFNANGRLGVNTSTAVATLHVQGSGKFVGTLTSTALSVDGSAVFGGSITAAGANINGSAEISGTLLVDGINTSEDDIYDIGSASTRFKSIYANIIDARTVKGTLDGPATELATSRKFEISGQAATVDPVLFNGSNDVDLSIQLNRSSISAQPAATGAGATHTLLVLDEGADTSTTLQKITKANFLSDLYPKLIPTGAIVPFAGTASVVEGFLKCDGSSYSMVTYNNLFAAIGTQYGPDSGTPGIFCVPSLTPVQTSSTPLKSAQVPISYYIKT